MLIFRILARFLQGGTVVKCKANQLLTLANDFRVAEDTGFSQGQLVIFGVFNQMHDVFELSAGLLWLAIEALGQNHRQRSLVCSHRAANNGRVRALRTGREDLISRQCQRVAEHLNQILMGNGDVPAPQNSNSFRPRLLNSGQLLQENIYGGGQIDRSSQVRRSRINVIIVSNHWSG